ncbi:MAG: cytochrome c biogenesis protein CcmE [Alphaproteobacteria bacterium 64-11]|nr:cytochrome c maturation protein CcmE [Alphaproteobacteria bacterium]OJU08250.1 MAG: cytochrome c biogenesis protein CcmE [Alphaproteobacteria bacterium 64-11]
MTAKKKRRLAFAAALVAAGGLVAAVIIWQLGQNTMYFRSPSDVASGQVGKGVAFRLGGLVANGSVHHGAGADVRFTVTDGKSHVQVDYRGVLPALFREGQGVVALGSLDSGGTFSASEVLAKHDEKYMPPEVVDSLKRAGRWKEGGT